MLLPTPGLSHRATCQLGDPKIWAIKAAHPSVAVKDRKGPGREQEDEGWGVLSYHCANHCHIRLLNKHVAGAGVSREGEPGRRAVLSAGQGPCGQQTGKKQEVTWTPQRTQRQSRCSHFSDDENSSGTLTALGRQLWPQTQLPVLVARGRDKVKGGAWREGLGF